MFFLGSSLNEETTVSRFYRFTRPCTAYSSPDPPHPTPPHVSLWIHSSELRRPYSPFPYYLSYSLDPRPISMCTAVYAYVRTYVLVDELWMKNIRLESRVASSWRGATGDRKFNYQMASKPIKYHGTYVCLFIVLSYHVIRSGCCCWADIPMQQSVSTAVYGINSTRHII